MLVTDVQVRLLRTKMKEGKTQEAAAASAGMSPRSARKWQAGPMPSESKKRRNWRTRDDPFESSWEDEVVPILEADERGKLEAKTLLEELCRRHPEKYTMKHLRTMQRRVRDWRALRGPDKEVYFEQVHEPGREAALDFTHASELDITVEGQPLRHLLFQLVLSYSGWTWASVAFGETFEALVDGLQRGLWKLGGAAKVLRMDNMSAATHELKRGGGRSLTKRFADVCEHLGIEKVTRINPGKSHENGVVEQRNHRTKRLLEQALILRGSRDFGSVERYEDFVQSTLDEMHNRHVENKLATERPLFRSLPARAVPAFTASHPIVKRWSTIIVGKRTYSVPSRLIGREVEARLCANTVEVRYRDEVIEVSARLRGQQEHRIDYRHVVGSLVRKPGAFARYRFREELFPSMVFRRAYDALRASHGDRADIEYVRVLHLAATTMECTVAKVLAEILDGDRSFDYASVEVAVRPRDVEHPDIQIGVPDLAVYDGLLRGGA